MASPIRKWLKTEDIYDPDLEKALKSQNINDASDFSKMTQSEWDKLWRVCVVERAKDLKNQKAKIRLEKKMKKLEKFWRKSSGIKQTSIKSKQSKSKKTNSKNPKTIKNEEYSNGGKELKDWMKKNKVWEKSLYDELMNNEIFTPQKLKQLNEQQFDDIVRKVRVDRFSQLKDQKSRNRADKLLINFEKLWRKSSGIKNTSIKKKKASPPKSPKTPEKSPRPPGDREEIMPWYLSGKQNNKKNSALASTPRNPHQKKKDNKIKDALRKSNKIELEWIEKYSIIKYNNFIAPKIEDKYNKNKNKNKNNCEKKEDEKIDENVPNLFQIQIDYEEIVVDVCIEMLLTLNESWEGRVSILNALIAQLCNNNISDDIYALKMCKFLCAIGHQFTDPRSLIIQAMEECISKLAQNTPKRFIIFVPYILTSLFTTFPVRIEALRDPGVKLGKFLISTLNEYDTSHELLRTVFSGLNSKHAAVRTECADYVDLMIRSIELLEKDDSNEYEKTLLNEIDTAIKKACKDASSEARMNGYRALNQYKNIAPNGAQEIIDKMTKAQSKKYNEANDNLHYT